MSRCQFKDQAPEAAKVTAYDESHAQDYLRLLDAEVSMPQSNPNGRRRCTRATSRAQGG